MQDTTNDYDCRLEPHTSPSQQGRSGFGPNDAHKFPALDVTKSQQKSNKSVGDVLVLLRMETETSSEVTQLRSTKHTKL